MMYAAHRAAGGITSVYRQIGIGGEELFRQLLVDFYHLTPSQAQWSYQVTTSAGRTRTLSLDGRIEIDHIASSAHRRRFWHWLKEAANKLDISPSIFEASRGAVFEVRQGYKSKDSKRQNADIANAAAAYSQGYIPVLVILSNQIDHTIADRYEQEKWLVLRGVLTGTATFSSYTFVQEVIGYDLAGSFKRNSNILKHTIIEVLEILLSADT